MFKMTVKDSKPAFTMRVVTPLQGHSEDQLWTDLKAAKVESN
jgi:hypothetical protein